MKINKTVFILFIVIFVISINFNLYFFFNLTFKKLFYHGNNKIIAKVIKVIDGDTFDVNKEERIRLYEINAPEIWF